MVGLPYEPEDVEGHLAGADVAERKLVGVGRGHLDRFDSLLTHLAARNGWQRSEVDDHWYPIEEPLPALPGSPAPADVRISLESILFGGINVALEINDARLDLNINDYDDELIFLARFVRTLAAGGEPHATLSDRTYSHFVVQNSPVPGMCRLYVNALPEAALERRVFDVLTDREKLVIQFRQLTTAIADHPWFAHLQICHCCLPEADYDRALDLAEAEWGAGVADGRWPDDIDAKEAFEAAKLVAEVSLPPECGRLAAKYRTMLRSLEIPEDLAEGLS